MSTHKLRTKIILNGDKIILTINDVERYDEIPLYDQEYKSLIYNFVKYYINKNFNITNESCVQIKFISMYEDSKKLITWNTWKY